MNTPKLIIGGYSASGKSTLCLLLDGHPRLRVSYFMEKFDRVLTAGLDRIRQASDMTGARGRNLKALFCLQAVDEIYNVHFITFRNLLELHSYLSIIEAESLVGETDSGATGSAIHGMSFNLDFEGFQRLWKERLFLTDRVLSREDVLDILYDCLFTSFRDVDWSHSDETMNVFCIENSLAPIELALADDFDAKFIIMRRPLKDMYAAFVERISYTNGLSNMREAEVRSREHWFRHPRLRIDRRIDELAARHPDRFMILDIADVVVDYRKTIPKIADFIGIEMDSILLRPTFHGREFPESAEYLGKVQDAEKKDLISTLSQAVFELQYREATIGEALACGHLPAGLEYTRLKLKRARWGRFLPI